MHAVIPFPSSRRPQPRLQTALPPDALAAMLLRAAEQQSGSIERVQEVLLTLCRANDCTRLLIAHIADAETRQQFSVYADIIDALIRVAGTRIAHLMESCEG